MPMSLIDTRTTRVLITVLFFTLVLAFLYVARHTLIVFLFAVFCLPDGSCRLAN